MCVCLDIFECIYLEYKPTQYSNCAHALTQAHSRRRCTKFKCISKQVNFFYVVFFIGLECKDILLKSNTIFEVCKSNVSYIYTDCVVSNYFLHKEIKK